MPKVKAAKEPAAYSVGEVVIFITDRRKFGGEIRMVPRPRFKCRTTGVIRRAARFPGEKAARAFLKAMEKRGRYCYTISKL
jgi:hypothetical protein